jgi:hypothetical protein
MKKASITEAKNNLSALIVGAGLRVVQFGGAPLVHAAGRDRR